MSGGETAEGERHRKLLTLPIRPGRHEIVNRLFAALLLVAALVAGCTGRGSDPGPDATVPTAPPTTPATVTTVAAGPFDTPSVIDAAYVERVLVQLNRVDGDISRKIIQTNRYERSDLDSLGAIFEPPLLEIQVGLFSDLVDLDRALFKDPVGNRRMPVLELITARPGCVFAKVRIDVSDVLVSPPPQEEKFITLVPKPADADPAGINPTPWSMANESSARQDPCAP